MPIIDQLTGQEILDSRGRPTVSAACVLSSGARGRASVPSGASTGAAEALELRDGDPGRYRGLGCRRAVANIAGPIDGALRGRPFNHQAALDGALIELDGTPNKARLGANAVLAVSLAFARAHALERGLPLFRHFADMIDEVPRSLPRPTINLFSGGRHAGGQIPIQDVLMVPADETIDQCLATAFEVYQCAADRAREAWNMRALTADEGGLAPPFPSAERMLDDAVEAVRRAGLEPGRDVALAVDVAATHFHAASGYALESGAGGVLDAEAMIERLAEWTERWPIVSIEDGLAEEEWGHWPRLRARLNPRVAVLGDDLLCTNPDRIRRAVETRAADALLLKVNQIGTLTEAAEALRLARRAGWQVTVSARSGETEDDWLADLAVGWSGDRIKIGSITQSERLAKYNRLLTIEKETAWPVADASRA